MSDSIEKAPAPAEMAREVATIGTDPNRWHYGDKIAIEDPIIQSRGQAKRLALYDELERDPQVGCELGKRRMALLGREWAVHAGAENDARAEQARDLVERALKGCKFNQAVEKLLDALLKGVAVAEVMWVIRGQEIMPAELRGRDPLRFEFRLPAVTVPTGLQDAPPPVADLRLLTKASPSIGEPVVPRKFVLHRFGSKYEHPWGLGLGSRLFWPVFFKRQGIGFWLSGLEKFGQPTALGKYPAGTKDGDLATLLSALQAVASEAGVAIPEGMAIELLEAKRNGTFDGYEKLARYMDEDISKVILGQTLTTSQGSSGSRALGQVHNEVRLELTKGDADLLSDTLNASLVRWIVDFNLPGYAALGIPYPAIWWDVSEPEDLVARADRDTKVKGLGYKPTPEYIESTYGDGWVPDQAPPDQPPPPPGTDLAAMFAEAPAPPKDAPDDLADQLDAVAGDAQDAMVRALRDLVDKSATLADVRDGLVRLVPNMPTAQLAELIGQALSVASLSGRSDLADGV